MGLLRVVSTMPALSHLAGVQAQFWSDIHSRRTMVTLVCPFPVGMASFF